MKRNIAFLLVVLLWIICIFVQDGLCMDKLSIRNIGLQQKVFTPDQGQKAVISFEITKSADVCVTIYDLLGRSVWLHKAFMPAGKASVEWSGLDKNNKPSCGDVFLYVITASADQVTALASGQTNNANGNILIVWT